MLRPLLLAAGRSRTLKRVAMNVPWTRQVVARFVSGETIAECLSTVRRLADQGLYSTIDFLGEDTTTASQADHVADVYVELLRELRAAGLSEWAEISIKLSALGSQLRGGDAIALDNARIICAAAKLAGTTVTVDMEDHETTTATLDAVNQLRRDYPWTGAVVQAYLHRTVDDCRALATPGSRVRLCKGAYAEPATLAYQTTSAIAISYQECLRVLFAGPGIPLVATHDPAMISQALAILAEEGRTPESYEFQLLLGIRPDEQRRLAAAGHRVRIYVPFGTDWYAYFLRRIAERPANLTFFLRALVSRGKSDPGHG
ncbi:MAG: proline dehydrogenase family protein [Micropruina sp.]|nr:proline dehydrogenase family protein [Micropruina sp.]